MSGIAGIIHLDGGPVDVRLLEAMSSAMAHRGPDGASVWHDGPVGLAHRMLHSTPEAVQETQPLRDESGQLVLVLDGRLDNREELKAAIEATGGRLRDNTDAELVLKSYECWAEDCPKHLLGDFAFAIWDGRRKCLFCARDFLGIRPLFYRWDGQVFLFASEMKALLLAGATMRINRLVVASYLCLQVVDMEQTLYADISRLPPAHVLRVEGSGLQKGRYWDIDASRSIRLAGDDEYAEQFRSIFRDAVRASLRSHGPVRISLSGGLDSSTVASMAALIHGEEGIPGQGLGCISVLFDSFPCDERRYIQDMGARWDLPIDYTAFEKIRGRMSLDGASSDPDLLYDVTLLMYLPALERMQQEGARVVLDGFGGDELMSISWSHLSDLFVGLHWWRLAGEVRSQSQRYHSSPFSLYVDYCLKPLIPATVKAALRPVREFLGNRTTFGLVAPEFLRTSGLGERLRESSSAPRLATRALAALYQAVFASWNNMGAEMNDMFCAGMGVEARHPLWDRRLVEFLFAIPEEQRWRGTESKFILRRAMRGLLPDSVRTRTDKAEFSLPIASELMDRQADRVEQLLARSVLVEMGIIQPEALARLVSQTPTGNSALASRLRMVVALEVFCRAALGLGADTTSRERWT